LYIFEKSKYDSVRICFVIPRIYAYFDNEFAKFAGGAERQASYLATGLAENKNFHVTCCVADFGQEDIVKINGITLLKAMKLSDGKISGFKKLLSALKKTDADLYIYRSADLGTALSIFTQQFFLKKRVLYMVASNSETSYRGLRRMSGTSAAIFMPLAYKTASLITAQSFEQFNAFHTNRKRKPDALIPNITKFTKIENKNKQGVIWVGRLDPVKQPHILIELAKKYPETRFTMIAPIVLEHEEFGTEIVKKINKVENINHINYVSPSEINDYYAKAQVYAITSYTEGFSNTMAEAIVAGCPILSYNVNPDQVITKNNFGFCSYSKMDQFYADFEKLIIDKKLCAEMGNNGQEYLAKHHNQSVVIEQFSELLLKLKKN